VLFVIDASGESGYSLSEQLLLRSEIVSRYPDIVIIDVLSKSDLGLFFVHPQDDLVSKWAIKNSRLKQQEKNLLFWEFLKRLLPFKPIAVSVKTNDIKNGIDQLLAAIFLQLSKQIKLK